MATSINDLRNNFWGGGQDAEIETLQAWVDGGYSAADIFANPTYGPESYGLLGWTASPMMAYSNVANAGNGAQAVQKIWVPKDISVTNVHLAVSAAGNGTTDGQCFVGLLDSTGAVIGKSASQHTAWLSTGWKTAALVGGPFDIEGGPGVFIWASYTQSATVTRANFSAIAMTGTVIGAMPANANLTAAQYQQGYVSGSNTDINAIVPGDLNSWTNLVFMAIS